MGEIMDFDISDELDYNQFYLFFSAFTKGRSMDGLFADIRELANCFAELENVELESVELGGVLAEDMFVVPLGVNSGYCHW